MKHAPFFPRPLDGRRQQNAARVMPYQGLSTACGYPCVEG